MHLVEALKRPAASQPLAASLWKGAKGRGGAANLTQACYESAVCLSLGRAWARAQPQRPRWLWTRRGLELVKQASVLQHGTLFTLLGEEDEEEEDEEEAAAFFFYRHQ